MMPYPSITDWMSGVGTAVAAVAAIVAAVAAIVAARYTKQAVHEATKAANAAAEQVKLQSPHPIVVATFSYSLSESTHNRAVRAEDFQLENIGDSPAFDVEVSTMEVPLSDGGSSRLETKRLSYLLPRSPTMCVHHLEPARGVLQVLGGAGRFAVLLVTFFDEKAKIEGSKSGLNRRYQIEFAVSYRGLDKTQFKQLYAFVVFPGGQRIWIEPTGSLLEAAHE
jgi:hypothetical protein